MLQGPLGWDEEVQEAAQPVPTVELLGHAEQLPEHRGCRGLKRWVEGRECVLYVGVEGFQILSWKRGLRNLIQLIRQVHWTPSQASTEASTVKAPAVCPGM